MVKVKDIKTKKVRKKAKITMKSLMQDVKKKLNQKQVNKVMKILEQKYEELEAANKVVIKLKKQISELEEMDINEIDTDDLEYSE